MNEQTDGRTNERMDGRTSTVVVTPYPADLKCLVMDNARGPWTFREEELRSPEEAGVNTVTP